MVVWMYLDRVRVRVRVRVGARFRVRVRGRGRGRGMGRGDMYQMQASSLAGSLKTCASSTC